MVKTLVWSNVALLWKHTEQSEIFNGTIFTKMYYICECLTVYNYFIFPWVQKGAISIYITYFSGKHGMIILCKNLNLSWIFALVVTLLKLWNLHHREKFWLYSSVGRSQPRGDNTYGRPSISSLAPAYFTLPG